MHIEIFCRVFSYRESGVVYWPEMLVAREQWDREAWESWESNRTTMSVSQLHMYVGGL